jgi:hypothetical protein
MIYENLLNQTVSITIGVHRKLRGTVLKVAADFVVVEDELIGAVMLPLEHVKQLTICFTSVPKSVLNLDLLSLGPIELNTLPDDLLKAFQTMKGTVVHLEGGGADPTVGYVVDVKRDFLVISVVQDGSVYFPIRHIQSVQPLDVSIRPEFMAWLQPQIQSQPPANCFSEMLQQAIGRSIQLGRGGPEGICGILRQVHDGFIEVVISPHEVVEVPIHHIKAFHLVEPRGWQPTVLA